MFQRIRRQKCRSGRGFSEPRLTGCFFVRFYFLLTDLTLISWQIEDFSGLERLSDLKTLHIYGADCLSYEGLDRLPSLKSINSTEEQKNAIMEAYPDNDFIFLV